MKKIVLFILLFSSCKATQKLNYSDKFLISTYMSGYDDGTLNTTNALMEKNSYQWWLNKRYKDSIIFTNQLIYFKKKK